MSRAVVTFVGRRSTTDSMGMQQGISGDSFQTLSRTSFKDLKKHFTSTLFKVSFKIFFEALRFTSASVLFFSSMAPRLCAKHLRLGDREGLERQNEEKDRETTVKFI